ncbi:S-layer homology domain-containing protein [Paenibacillus hodogayensis]
MKLAGLDTNISATEVEAALHAFSDRTEVDSWAESSVAAAVKNGIVTGSYSHILPTSNMTRAEVAKIVWQLLENAKLIAGNR